MWVPSLPGRPPITHPLHHNRSYRIKVIERNVIGSQQRISMAARKQGCGPVRRVLSEYLVDRSRHCAVRSLMECCFFGGRASHVACCRNYHSSLWG